MVDVDVYVINDDEYYLIGEEIINGSSYLYLSKVSDENDFIFRKRDTEDSDVLVSLENEEEVKMVALVFANKVLG